MANFLGGAISYGGFTTLTEMAKDQKDNPLLSFFAPFITRSMMRNNLIDGVRGLETIARSGIPLLALHGELDGPVPVRHTYAYEKEFAQLRAQYPQAVLK